MKSMSIKMFTQKAWSVLMTALLCVLPLYAMAAPNIEQAGEESNITFEEQMLVMGKTYTSADFNSIKSGCFSISADGKTVTFSNLKINSTLKLFYIKNVNTTIVLEGDNNLRTTNYYVVGLDNSTLTITGSGSLTTYSTWYDIWLWPGNVIIDNTTLVCNGPIAIGNNNWKNANYFNVTVKNSSFKGYKLFRLTSLTLKECLITYPSDGYFDPEEMESNQIKTKDGYSNNSFTIEKDRNIAFRFHYKGKEVEDNAIVTIYATEDNWGYGEMECVTNPEANPNDGLIVVTTDGRQKSGTASIEITSKTFTANMVQWCMGGECVPMNNKTSFVKSFTTDDKGVGLVQFDATNITTEGALTAKLTITIGNDTKTVNIRFVYNQGGSNADDFWWGYFSDSDTSKLDYSGYIGWGSANTINACICVPAQHPIAGEGTVKAVRFWLGDDISAISSDVTLWISTTINGTPIYKQTIPRAKLTSRLNTVTLDIPYSVNNDKFYLGYTFTTNARSYPVMGGGDDTPNAWFYRAGNNSWEDLYGEGNGKLAIQMLISGVTLPFYSAVPFDFGTNKVEKNKTATIPVKIQNTGKEPITAISYTINTNGQPTTEKEIRLNSLAFNNTAWVNIPFSSDADTRKYDKTLVFTKVNGQPNESAVKTARGSLITYTEKFTPVPVVEEFTGTWCGWCTVGYDGMEKTNETFGDKVVLIAVHNSDPMETSDYNAIASRASGYPSSLINRSTALYPSASNLKYTIDKELREIALGQIQAEAVWADADKSSIYIKTASKFSFTDNDAHYGIAFVLIENGMRGSGSSWAQSNYLSGNSTYANSYPFWYSAGSSVSGIEFNHVAVAAWDIANGVNGSMPSTFSADETKYFSYTVDIASNTIIQDKAKLSVAALLIDRSNGSIVNAAKVTIKDNDPSAVSGINVDNCKETGRFTVDGRQITAPQRGLNIVKMSDGTIRKTLVK